MSRRPRERDRPSREPTVWSPATFSSRPVPDTHREGEIETIVRVLRERGPLGRRSLRRLTESRLWGPGRFGRAFSEARRRGLVRRVGFRTFAATDSSAEDGTG